MHYKITEIIYVKSNVEKIKEGAIMTGEHNILIPAFAALKKELDRKKISYIFKFENLKTGGIIYHYALNKQEIEEIKKIIPNF